MVKFGSARIDENGRARGGKAGDQTGCECMIQQAYWHKNGWRGIRAKDPNVANGIAWTMACACQSNLVGYNQDERYAIFWTDLREGVLTNADCSTLVPFCVIKAGVDVDVNGITILHKLKVKRLYDVVNPVRYLCLTIGEVEQIKVLWEL